LVAVAAEPAAAVVVPLVGKAHRDAIAGEGPDFLDQPVVELAIPLASQERFDGGAALEKLRAIAPAAVDRVGERNAGGIARIPCISGQPCLLRGGLGGEGGKRWTAHLESSRFGGSGRRQFMRVTSNSIRPARKTVRGPSLRWGPSTARAVPGLHPNRI